MKTTYLQRLLSVFGSVESVNSSINKQLIVFMRRSVLLLSLIIGLIHSSFAVDNTFTEHFEGPYYVTGTQAQAFRFSGTLTNVDGTITPDWYDNSTGTAWVGYGPSGYGHGTLGGTTCQAIQFTNSGSIAGSKMQFIRPVTLSGTNYYNYSIYLEGTAGHKVTVYLRRHSATPPWPVFMEQEVTLTGTSGTSNWIPVKGGAYVGSGTADFGISTTEPGTDLYVDDASFTSTAGGPPTAWRTLGVLPTFVGMHYNYLSEYLLMNGGFQGANEHTFRTLSGTANLGSGTVANGWTVFGPGDPATTYSPDTWTTNSGGSSQKVVMSGTSSMKISQNVYIDQNAHFTGTVWFRSGSGTGAGGQASLCMINAVSGSTISNIRTVTMSSGSWTPAAISGTAQAAESRFQISSTNGRTFYIDDATLVGGPTALAYPNSITAAKTVRLWDCDVTWAAIEPQRNYFYWDKLDALVRKAKGSGTGVSVILTLGQTPTWASADATLRSYYGLGASAQPSDLRGGSNTYWKEYVQAVANHFSGTDTTLRIDAISIWNEPGASLFFTGSASDLATMAKDAYSVIKTTGSTTGIHIAVLTPEFDTPAAAATYFAEFSSTNSAGNYCDAVAVHSYDSDGIPPENDAWKLANYRAAVQAGSVNKAIWNTEGACGYVGQTDSSAAAWLVRKYLINAIYGMDCFCFYTWNDDNSPLGINMAQTGHILSPTAKAASAFNYLAHWLPGAKITAATSDYRGDGSGIWAVDLTLSGSNGSALAKVVWSPNSGTNAVLFSGTGASWTNLKQKYSLIDGSHVMTTGTISLDETPVLLTGSTTIIH